MLYISVYPVSWVPLCKWLLDMGVLMSRVRIRPSVVSSAVVLAEMSRWPSRSLVGSLARYARPVAFAKQKAPSLRTSCLARGSFLSLCEGVGTKCGTLCPDWL